MASIPQLSLDSVTRVRESRTIFSNPLANDLQKIMQAINDIRKDVAAIGAASSGSTPVTPTEISDFIFPPEPAFRDDGAMDVAMEALMLASGPQTVPQSPQIIFCTQATFPALSGVPANTLIAVTDYAHLIYWDGSTSSFLDGGNCFIALFDIDPGIGWHLLDGTVNVPYLKADGTLGTYTVEDASVAFYLKASTTNSGPNAAVAPTISGVTENAPTGISVSPAAAATAGAGTALAGATQAVLIPPFSGGGGGGGVTDPQHHHGLTSANAPISATGEPRNLARRPYFRK